MDFIFYFHISIIWYHILFIHLSVVGYLGCLYFLAIMNNAAVTIYVPVFVWMHVFSWVYK